MVTVKVDEDYDMDDEHTQDLTAVDNTADNSAVEETRKTGKEESVDSYTDGYDSTDSNATKTNTITSNGKTAAQDVDMVSAAEALTQLTRQSTASPPASPFPTVVSENSAISPLPSQQHPFVKTVNQVSRHPIVTNAVKYYEELKRNYASFNYAAGFIEKAAIPVVSKIEDELNERHRLRMESKKKKRSLLEATLDEKDSLNSKYDGFSDDERGLTPQLSTASCVLQNVAYDTKKRLQFCVHILRLATDHISSKVNLLQQKVLEKEKEIKEQRESQDSTAQQQETRKEIITTVRKVFRLISNFRPSLLTTAPTVPTTSVSSPNSTPAPMHTALSPISPSDDPRMESAPPTPQAISDPQFAMGELKESIRKIILTLPKTIQQANGTQQANDRILVVAKESLEMIARLSKVFNEQLAKAEDWVTGEEQHLEQNKEHILQAEKLVSDEESGEERQLKRSKLDAGATGV